MMGGVSVTIRGAARRSRRRLSIVVPVAVLRAVAGPGASEAEDSRLKVNEFLLLFGVRASGLCVSWCFCNMGLKRPLRNPLNGFARLNGKASSVW